MTVPNENSLDKLIAEYGMGLGSLKRSKIDERPQLNPFNPDRFFVQITANRRRWIHVFPVDRQVSLFLQRIRSLVTEFAGSSQTGAPLCLGEEHRAHCAGRRGSAHRLDVQPQAADGGRPVRGRLTQPTFRFPSVFHGRCLCLCCCSSLWNKPCSSGSSIPRSNRPKGTYDFSHAAFGRCRRAWQVASVGLGQHGRGEVESRRRDQHWLEIACQVRRNPWGSYSTHYAFIVFSDQPCSQSRPTTLQMERVWQRITASSTIQCLSMWNRGAVWVWWV